MAFRFFSKVSKGTNSSSRSRGNLYKRFRSESTSPSPALARSRSYKDVLINSSNHPDGQTDPAASDPEEGPKILESDSPGDVDSSTPLGKFNVMDCLDLSSDESDEGGLESDSSNVHEEHEISSEPEILEVGTYGDESEKDADFSSESEDKAFTAPMGRSILASPAANRVESRGPRVQSVSTRGSRSPLVDFCSRNSPSVRAPMDSSIKPPTSGLSKRLIEHPSFLSSTPLVDPLKGVSKTDNIERDVTSSPSQDHTSFSFSSPSRTYVDLNKTASASTPMVRKMLGLFSHLKAVPKSDDYCLDADSSVYVLRDHLQELGTELSSRTEGEFLPFSELADSEVKGSLSPLTVNESIRSFPTLPPSWYIRGHSCLLRNVLDVYARAHLATNTGGVSSIIMSTYVTLVESVASNHMYFPPGASPLRPEGIVPMKLDFVEIDASDLSRSGFKLLENYKDLSACIRLLLDYTRGLNSSEKPKRFPPLDTFVTSSAGSSQLCQRMGIVNFFTNLKSQWKSAEEVLSTLKFPRPEHVDIEHVMHKFVSDVFNLWGLCSLLGYVTRENSYLFQDIIKNKIKAFANSFPIEARNEIIKNLAIESFSDSRFNLSLYLCGLAYASSRENEYLSSHKSCFLHTLFCPVSYKNPVIPLPAQCFSPSGLFKRDQEGTYYSLIGSKRSSSDSNPKEVKVNVVAVTDKRSRKDRDHKRKYKQDGAPDKKKARVSVSDNSLNKTTQDVVVPTVAAVSSSPSDPQLIVIRACKNRKDFYNYLMTKGLDPRRPLDRCYRCAALGHRSISCDGHRYSLSFSPMSAEEVKIYSAQ